MPKNTPLGFFIGIAALLGGFGLVWDIWWLAALGLLVIMALVTYRAFQTEKEYVISAGEIRQQEKDLELKLES